PSGSSKPAVDAWPATATWARAPWNAAATGVMPVPAADAPGWTSSGPPSSWSAKRFPIPCWSFCQALEACSFVYSGMRTLASLALLTGCYAHASSPSGGGMEQAASEPTVESKLRDPYATAGVPSGQPLAGQPAVRHMEMATVAAREAAPGAMETAGEAIAGLFRRDKKEAETIEAPEPDPNRQRPE